MRDRTVVNGLVVPAALVDVLLDDWTQNLDKALASSRIGVDMRGLRLFDLDFVVGPLAAQWLELPEEFLGTPCSERRPGDIDPVRSVAFGESVADQPIALDYRTPEPSVVALDSRGRWIEIASSASEFLARLDASREFDG